MFIKYLLTEQCYTPKENGQMRTSYISLCYLYKINLGLGVVVGGVLEPDTPPPPPQVLPENFFF